MPQPNMQNAQGISMQSQYGQMTQQPMPAQPGMQSTQQPEEKKSKLWIWIVLLIIIILGAGGYYFFLR